MNRNGGSKYPYGYGSGQHLARLVALIGKFQRNENQTRPAHNNKNTQEDALARYTRRLTIATWIIAIAAVLSFGAALLQWSALRRQLDDAEIQEAASITIRNLTVIGFPDDPIVSYDVLNTGHTRANHVSIWPGYMNFPASEEMSVLGDKQGFGGPPRPNEYGITIDPTDAPRHRSVRFGPVPKYPDMPPGELKKLPSRDDIKSGRAVSVFYVIGIYSDVYGNIQHVDDCIIFDGGTGFDPCLGHQNRHY